MKKLLLLTILSSSLMNAQTLQERFESFVCDCFTEKEAEFKTTQNLDILDSCFDFPMEDYEEELEALIAKNIDTTQISPYDAGMIYGKRMFSEIQSTLVKTCDPYYHAMTITGEVMLRNMKAGIDQSRVDSLTTQIEANPEDYNLIWERGACYMALEDNAKAIADFEFCLENEPDFPPALFFLGWTYDLTGDKAKAMDYYQKVLDLNNDLLGFNDVTRIKMAIIERNAKN